MTEQLLLEESKKCKVKTLNRMNLPLKLTKRSRLPTKKVVTSQNLKTFSQFTFFGHV